MPINNETLGIFLSTNQYLRDKKTPPYYLESKMYDLSFVLSNKEKYLVVSDIVEHDKAASIFRYYKRNRILSELFPELDKLSAVPQRKSKSRNAFEHVMNVLEQIDCSSAYYRWLAIFHDLGKHKSFFEDHNFNKHALYSCEITEVILSKWDIVNIKKDLMIAQIKAHMWPLDYQRNPNWTDAAIVNFVKRCGTQSLALAAIQFSIYDKQAENDNPDFLIPLKELHSKVKKVII